MLNNYLFNINILNFTPVKPHLTHKESIMKIFIYTLMAIALGLIIFNATQLDFKHLTEGNSMIALVGILASLCAVCILLIFMLAKNIEEKTKRQ